MDKFRIEHTPKSMKKAKGVGGVKKNKSGLLKKKLKNVMKTAISEFDQPDDLTEFHMPGIETSISKKKKTKLSKNKSFIVDTFDASSIENNSEADEKYESSVNGDYDTILEQESDGINTGNEVLSGKRKRKRKTVSYNYEDSSPLVVEVQKPETVKTPMLLNKFSNDTNGNLEENLKLFYESLKEISANLPENLDFTVEEMGEKNFTVEEVEEKSETLVETEKYAVVSNDIDSDKESQYIVVKSLPNPNQFIVFLKHPYSIYLKGRLNISVLRGSVEILGYVMDSHSNSPQTLTSVRGSSMLTINTCYSDPPSAEDYELLSKKFEELELDVLLTRKLITNVEDRSCVLLLERTSPCQLENFLKTSTVFPALFDYSPRVSKKFQKCPQLRKVGQALSCLFQTKEAVDQLYQVKGRDWDEKADAILRSNKNAPGCCTVVCGGKSVGKSTFLRYLANRHLTVFGEVLYLDFDPGQTEFTIPGCVSATVVKTPLLGQNYTNQLSPECIVNIGEVNISLCPNQYVESVKYILQFCNSRPELKKMPWIVNTMGFNRGLGVDLTVSLIRFLDPRYVVEIMSFSPESNFPCYLMSGYVYQYQSKYSPQPSNFLEYTFISLNSAYQEQMKKCAWKMEPRQLRDACIFSYISRMVQPPTMSLLGVIPYKVKFSKLTLCVSLQPVSISQYLRAINGNLVALCIYNGNDALIPNDPSLPRVLEKWTTCPCLGHGIVRGIDLERKKVYVVTPLSTTELERVNCLMLGNVGLPTCLYTSCPDATGTIPYAVVGTGQITGERVRSFN